MVRTAKGKYILNLQIDDVNTAKKVLEILKSFGLVDAVIWSNNGEVLDLIHKSISFFLHIYPLLFIKL